MGRKSELQNPDISLPSLRVERTFGAFHVDWLRGSLTSSIRACTVCSVENGEFAVPDFQRLMKETLSLLGWEEKPELNPEKGAVNLKTSYSVNGQICDLFIHMQQNSDLIDVYLYAPISLPLNKVSDACVLANHFNIGLTFGRIAITDTGRIQFNHCIDVEGCEPGPMVVANMISGAGAAFNKALNAFGVLTFTDSSVENIIADFAQKA